MNRSGAAPSDFPPSSGPGSSMDSNNHHRRRLRCRETKTLTNRSPTAELTVADGGNSEMWNSFTDNFQQVQEVLDRNRVLIQQVNDNHQSKIHDNLVQNVSLIQEINGNINKVVSLYSDLSANFSDMCQKPRNTAVQSMEDARNYDS